MIERFKSFADEIGNLKLERHNFESQIKNLTSSVQLKVDAIKLLEGELANARAGKTGGFSSQEYNTKQSDEEMEDMNSS